MEEIWYVKHLVHFLRPLTVIPQFTYNPEWFDDTDEEEEDWDLEKYRKEKEEEDLAAEEARIRTLQLADGQLPEASADG